MVNVHLLLVRIWRFCLIESSTKKKQKTNSEYSDFSLLVWRHAVWLVFAYQIKNVTIFPFNLTILKYKLFIISQIYWLNGSFYFEKLLFSDFCPITFCNLTWRGSAMHYSFPMYTNRENLRTRLVRGPNRVVVNTNLWISVTYKRNIRKRPTWMLRESVDPAEPAHR